MPRPQEVTDEQIAAWENEFKNDSKDIPPILVNVPLIRETLCVGCWLDQELDRLGVAEQ